MIENRSAPPGRIVPSLAYRDVAKAIDWLCRAFGFTERLRTPPEPNGAIHHAQLAIGDGSVILTASPDANPHQFAGAVMVRVSGIEAHCQRARQAGARILSPPDDKSFGERQYNAEDLEGHRWAFTESVADVAPETWGAAVSHLADRLAQLPRPRLCYLLIPAADPRRAAAFYERVFGWNIRHRDTDHPSFDDAGSNVSGAWFKDRTPVREAGLGMLPYIWVDDIDATLAAVAAHGGETVEPSHPDSPGSSSYIATFRDPEGNLMGLNQ